MYTTKEIAKICNVSVSKIHYFDSINILRPNLKRDENNYRIFTDEDIIWINDIICFQNTGISLNMIVNIVQLIEKNDNKSLVEIFKNHKQSIENEIQKLEKTLSRVEYKINLYSKRSKNAKF